MLQSFLLSSLVRLFCTENTFASAEIKKKTFFFFNCAVLLCKCTRVPSVKINEDKNPGRVYGDFMWFRWIIIGMLQILEITQIIMKMLSHPQQQTECNTVSFSDFDLVHWRTSWRLKNQNQRLALRDSSFHFVFPEYLSSAAWLWKIMYEKEIKGLWSKYCFKRQSLCYFFVWRNSLCIGRLPFLSALVGC